MGEEVFSDVHTIIRCKFGFQKATRAYSNPMAQTTQRAKASSSKRKLEDTASDPVSPPGKRKKTATARKSTGGKAPPRRTEPEPQGGVLSSVHSIRLILS